MKLHVHQLKATTQPGVGQKCNILAMGVVNTIRGFFHTYAVLIERLRSDSQWVMSALCVSVLLRELELHRKSSATDIAKKKQEAESAVSTRTHMQTQSYSLCVGIIDHCF